MYTDEEIFQFQEYLQYVCMYTCKYVCVYVCTTLKTTLLPKDLTYVYMEYIYICM